MIIAKQYRVLLGSTLLTIATVLLVFGWPGNQNSEPVTEPLASETALPSSLQPVELQWRAGTTQHYDVLIDSSFSMTTAGTGSTQTMPVHVSANLELRTLTVNNDEALVGMILSAVDMEISGQSDTKTNRLLSLPFRVHFTEGGMPTEFEFPAELTLELRGIIENLLRIFQLSLNSGESWVTSEPHASGLYEAKYQRKSSALIEKNKLRFIESTTDSKPDISSTESIRLDAKLDWVESMSVDETQLSTDANGFTIKVISQATLNLRPDSAKLVSQTVSFWDFSASEPADQPVTAIISLPHEEAVKQLHDNINSLDIAIDNRGIWVHRLRDLIKLDDKLSLVLLQVMKTQTLTDRTRSELYLVLELAGTPQSQAALISIIGNNSWTQHDNLRAIVALSGVSIPTPESISSLWQMTNNAESDGDLAQLANTATLALGTLGQGMHTLDNSDYYSLRSDLLNGALSETQPRQRVAYIHALGNTADASLAGDIIGLLNNPEASVRKATAQTVGKLDAQNFANELTQQFEQEESSVVRAAITAALVSWDEPSYQLMSSIQINILTEVDENTRFSMAQLLGRHLQQFPENKAVLKQLLSVEKSKRIRLQVAEVLAAYK